MSSPSICGYDGHAGKDDSGAPLRLYSEAECSAKGGNWHGNGECYYPSGGSLSWDCRGVNSDPVAMLYERRYYIGGAVVLGGLLYWRMRSRA